MIARALGIVVLFAGLFQFEPPPNPQEAVPRIAYGYSTSGIGQDVQEEMLQGFRLALLASQVRYQLSVEVHDSHDPSGVAGAARRLLDKRPLVLTGFPRSSEALIAAREAKARGVMCLLPAAGHSALREMGPYVYSNGDTMAASMRATVDLAIRQFPSRKGLLIVKENNPASLDARDEILKIAKTTDTVELVAHPLDSTERLSSTVIEELRSHSAGFLLVTLYPHEAAAMMQQLVSEELDIPVLAVSSWTTGDIGLLRRLLADRISPTYSLSLYTVDSPFAMAMGEESRRLLGVTSNSTYMAYGYEMGIIVAQVLKRLGPYPTPEDFVTAFHSNRCFSDTFSGSLCFGPEGGQVQRRSFSVAFDPRRGWTPLH